MYAQMNVGEVYTYGIASACFIDAAMNSFVSPGYNSCEVSNLRELCSGKK